MKYSAYPEYKTSEMNWLNEIPIDWKLRKLRFIVSENFANGIFKKSTFWGTGRKVINVTDVYTIDDLVNQGNLDRLECSDEEYEKYSVKHGDFFLVRSSLKLEGIGKSASILEPEEETVFECHLVRGRPDLTLVDSRFLNYLLNSKYCRDYFVSIANIVTMSTIDQAKFKSINLPLPLLNVQIKIAAFLDHKTAQIDRLIEKKKALIEKLNEKRMALITQAVTKGLSPEVPMKRSGVDWLGDVPEHWVRTKLRFLVRENFVNGIFKKSEYWGKGTPIVNVTDLYVHNDLISQHVLDRLECDDDEIKKYSALHGDFFLVRSSLKLEGIGKSATILEPIEDTVFECHVVRGRPELDRVEPRFLNLYLNSKYSRDFFISRSNIVTMATIDQEKLKSLFALLPPLAEQQDIVKYVDNSLRKIDLMSRAVEKVITKIEEYRTALITAAVTGKIDVRGIDISNQEAA